MKNFLAVWTAKLSDPNSAILFLWSSTGVVIIITFLAAFLKIRSSPQTLALHYNVIVGVDVLGSRNKLYQVPLTAVAIGAVNLILLRLLRLRQRFLPVLLAAVTLVCAVILLAATLFLYQVN